MILHTLTVIFWVLFCFTLQNEREEAEARFTKLKLQAKAKMASLTKQITELKGQEGTTVSFSAVKSCEAKAANTIGSNAKKWTLIDLLFV